MRKWMLVLVLLLPMAAHAGQCNCDDDEDDDEFHPYSYLGIKGGTSHFVDPTVTGGSATGTGYGAYYGRRYSQYFAVEGQYTFLGPFPDVTTGGRGHATVASLDAVHQVDMGWADLIVKLGLANSHTVVNGVGKDHVDVDYGAGLEWGFSRDLLLRVSYDRYKVNLLGNISTVGFANLGIAYKFR